MKYYRVTKRATGDRKMTKKELAKWKNSAEYRAIVAGEKIASAGEVLADCWRAQDERRLADEPTVRALTVASRGPR